MMATMARRKSEVSSHIFQGVLSVSGTSLLVLSELGCGCFSGEKLAAQTVGAPRRLRNQLIKDGKSDQEIKDILGNVIPELLENQKKGITGRSLLGAPTVWAASFSPTYRL